jgi:hypothetical protein
LPAGVGGRGGTLLLDAVDHGLHQGFLARLVRATADMMETDVTKRKLLFVARGQRGERREREREKKKKVSYVRLQSALKGMLGSHQQNNETQNEL